MRTTIFFLIYFLSSAFISSAQLSPTQIKHQIWDIHALRYYSFTTQADSIMLRFMEKQEGKDYSLPYEYKKTGLEALGDEQFVTMQMNYAQATNSMMNKLIFRPYRYWLHHAKPSNEETKNLGLSLLLTEEWEKDNQIDYRTEGIFDFLGQEDMTQVIDDILGDIDLFRSKNEVLLTKLSAPLSKSTFQDYEFYLFSTKELNNIPCYEIAFFSTSSNHKNMEGFLYINRQDLSLVKAIVTINYSLRPSVGRNLLSIHTFKDDKLEKKETYLLVGDDNTVGLVASQLKMYKDKVWNEWDTHSLTTPIQAQTASLSETASYTPAYNNLENLASLLLTDYVYITKSPDRFRFGPVSRIVSYNKIEGVRFRLGMDMATHILPQLRAKFYVAYGLKDEEFKFRTDLSWSFSGKKNVYSFPKSLLTLTILRDLNIPGQNVLSNKRDNLFYSIIHNDIENLSLQKLFRLSYEQEFKNNFSFEVSGRYLYDEPVRIPYYENLTTTELCLGLRFAPGEKNMQVEEKRMHIRKPSVEINLKHRIGIKGIFHSDYNYHITEANIWKRFRIGRDITTIDLGVSAGKVWNKLPFPLLFIPRGNESIIYEEEFNLMDFYEFITDNYIEGRMDIRLNWSPFSLFAPQLGIKTHIGGKILYGPLSDKNNPKLHPDLLPFSYGVKPLGDDPYSEISIGFTNILKYFRIDYVRRLTLIDDNTTKGGIFIGAGFSF